MSDSVQKLFVKSFIGYLKQQVEGQTLAPDALESLEVAVQCLQAAFDLGEEEEPQQSVAGSSDATASASQMENDINLFEMFQSLFIERNPRSLEVAEQIKNEANRLMKEGKYQEALVQYSRAITFDPKNPIFYCNRAAAYIRLGENDRAMRDCKSALVYNPKYGKAYGRMGIALSNLGKFADAQEAYSKAIEIEPDNQDYRANLEVAKNQRSQVPNLSEGLNLPPQISGAIGSMLSNPTYRTLLTDWLANEPRLMNMFESLYTRSDGELDTDRLMQVFQMASGFANNQGNPSADDPGSQPQP